MTERRVTVKYGNEELTGWDVPVDESIDRATELRLEDGAVIRVKVVVSAVIRIDGKTDGDGNPLYVVKAANNVSLVTPPTRLRDRKAQ